MKKRVCMLLLFAFVLCTAMTAYAASTEFSAVLPKNQGDTEVSTVRKGSDYNFFTIGITSISNNMTKVCAWTEGEVGNNLSSPYRQIANGETLPVFYDVTPGIGTNVVLNLDFQVA